MQQYDEQYQGEGEGEYQGDQDYYDDDPAGSPPPVDHSANVQALEAELEAERQAKAEVTQRYEAIIQQQQQAAQEQQMSLEQQQHQQMVLEARESLGLPQMEQKLAQYAQIVEQQAQEKQAAQMDALKSKYPDFKMEVIEGDLKELAKTEPELAAQMRQSPAALERLYKAAKSTAMQHGQPDNMSRQQYGNRASAVDRKVMDGKASELELGEYLTKISSKR